MKDLFVSYEQAAKLKELGFDEPCFGFYTHNGEIRRYTNFDGELNDFQTLKNSRITMGDGWCTAPTYQQVLRWFREKYELHGYIEGMYPWCRYYINSQDDRWEGHKYDTYEECENVLINKLIEIKTNHNGKLICIL
jgi:hypothetical protein